MKKARAIGLAALCALVGSGSALAATGTLRGNSQGVKVAEHVMDAFSHIPGFTYSQSNFFQMATKGGSSPSLHYRFGYGSLPSGWASATEKGAMALSANHIVWWRDDLIPTSKRAQAVEIVFNGNGKFWAFGGAAHHGCFRPLSQGSTMPYDSGFVVTGKVTKPQQQSGSIKLTYSYPWAGTSRSATETDIVNGSYLVSSGKVAIAGYSFSFNNSFGGSGPAPDVHLCQ
jgi:hypothetical protein